MGDDNNVDGHQVVGHVSQRETKNKRSTIAPDDRPPIMLEPYEIDY